MEPARDAFDVGASGNGGSGELAPPGRPVANGAGPGEPGRHGLPTGADGGRAESRLPSLRHLSVDRGAADVVRVRAEVVVGGRVGTGEARGVGREPAELRAAADATLRAIRDALGEGVPIHLLGIKDLKAFDAPLAVVALGVGAGSTTRRIGAAPVRGSFAEGAARATLDAFAAAAEAEAGLAAVLEPAAFIRIVPTSQPPSAGGRPPG